MEARAFRDSWRELQEQNARLFGVSPDGVESHRNFVAKLQLPYRLLSDPTTEMMQKYQAWGDRSGKPPGVTRSTVWVGPDGAVCRHWTPVTALEDHVAEVVAALRGAGS